MFNESFAVYGNCRIWFYNHYCSIQFGALLYNAAGPVKNVSKFNSSAFMEQNRSDGRHLHKLLVRCDKNVSSLYL